MRAWNRPSTDARTERTGGLPLKLMQATALPKGTVKKPAKVDGPKRKRTEEELFQSLREHTSLMASYCAAFDAGDMVMALPLSMSLRVLFHKPRDGEALLRQVELINGQWFDVSAPFPAVQAMDSCNLVALEFDGQIGRSIPHLSGTPWNIRTTPFESWWRSPIGHSQLHGTLSREDIVLGLANREAGHVDEEVGLKALALRDGTFLAVKWYVDDFESHFKYVAHAAVRTIAHETLISLRRFDPRTIGAQYSWRHSGREDVELFVLPHGVTTIPEGAIATPEGRFPAEASVALPSVLGPRLTAFGALIQVIDEDESDSAAK